MQYGNVWRSGVYAAVVSMGLFIASDAMPTSAAAVAYLGTPVSIPGKIEAENFDNGAEGSAYHDTTPGNAGGQYRSTNVDIENATGGGYDVGYIATGEWLHYAVTVTSAGPYMVQLRVASPVGASMHVSFNAPSNVSSSVTIPVTGDWQAWTIVSVPMTLGAGAQQMTLLADSSYYNLDSITIGKASAPANAIVPNIVGHATSSAAAMLTSAGLISGSVVLQTSNTIASGIVISESPSAGSSVARNTAVALVASTGPVAAPPSPPSPPPAPGARIVLEDFSSLRMNHDLPPTPLWQPYVTGDSTGPNQTGSVVSGLYHLITGSGDQPYWMFLPYPYNVPTGFAKGNLRSGTWSAGVNRLTFWMRTSARIARKPGGDQTAEIGTYTKQNDGMPSNQGDHYYHYLCADWWPNRWMLVTLNRQVQHKVSQDAGINWPENPTAPGWNYFDGLTRFYFTSEYGDPSLWGNQTFDFSDVEFGTTPGEPDALVASVTATYTGTHYELSWQGPKNQNLGYTVRYATSSLHAGAAGTAGGTVNNPGNTYQGTFWASASMAQPAGGMYFAIQPLGSTTFTEIYLPAR